MRAVTLTENEHVFMMVFSENYTIITDKKHTFHGGKGYESKSYNVQLHLIHINFYGIAFNAG